MSGEIIQITIKEARELIGEWRAVCSGSCKGRNILDVQVRKIGPGEITDLDAAAINERLEKTRFSTGWDIEVEQEILRAHLRFLTVEKLFEGNIPLRRDLARSPDTLMKPNDSIEMDKFLEWVGKVNQYLINIINSYDDPHNREKITSIRWAGTGLFGTERRYQLWFDL